jgi:hypothetical protein
MFTTLAGAVPCSRSSSSVGQEVREVIQREGHFQPVDRNAAIQEEGSRAVHDLREPQDATFAELLIDAEEDPYLRAVLVGMLRDGQQGSSR